MGVGINLPDPKDFPTSKSNGSVGFTTAARIVPEKHLQRGADAGRIFDMHGVAARKQHEVERN